jgi:peptide/nickel transport system substrate-binding protein
MRAGLAATGRRAWQRAGGAASRAVRTRRGRAVVSTCAVVGLVTLAAACGPADGSSTSGGSAADISDTSTVTYAMQPGGQATYIFPFLAGTVGLDADSVFDIDDFQYMLYRPLYWFGTGVNPYLNPQVSLAETPVYHGHQVTIRLKSTNKWSNGEPVDADDVVFWMNMMAAMKDGVYYSTTGLPSDVTNVKAASKYVVTMDITSPKFSESWFTNNELSEITPMPMAWDRTASGPSNCVANVSDCTAVYDYLNSQATNVSTYGSSPLWGVVDGPWKTQSLNSQGKLVLKYNKSYSGPTTPGHITTFIEIPFTSEQAEYNVLQDPTGSQTIDVGYLPTVDAPVPPAGANVGSNPSSLSDYKLTVDYAWQLSYMPYNFRNDTGQAPIFDQLYFRQAFQSLVDQEGVISGPLHGYGKPTIGPVSDYPVTKYLSPQIANQGDQWTLSISRAETLLRDNGWSVNPNGTDTCIHAGTGAGECGAKIAAGTPLKFNLIYATGIDWMESAVRELSSNASLAGIQLSLTAESFGNVVGAAFGCDPGVSGSNCKWQLALWGSWTYQPDYLPTGDTLFQGGAPNNAGDYDTTQNNTLIQDTLDARTPAQFDKSMYTWQNYLAGQLPVVYQPDNATLVETINGLDIGPQNSAFTITPEDWHYLK